MDAAHFELDSAVTLGALIAAEELHLKADVWPPGSRDRPVTWVHMTEQLDPRPHTRISELICTLGSSLVRTHSAEIFVSALVESGCAAVCLGLGEIHLNPPAALVRACEEAGLPLLLLPHGIPFLAVNDEILERRHRVESAVRRSETALLSELIQDARLGAGEGDLIRRAEDELGIRVKPTSIGRTKQVVHTTERALPPDKLGGGEEGTRRMKTPSQAFLTQFSSIVELAERERERAADQQLTRLGQLIDLAADDLALPAVLAPDLDAHGLEGDALRVSCWPRGSEVALMERLKNAVIGLTSRDVIVLSRPEDDPQLRDLNLVFGYSSSVALESLNRAVSQARAALSLARNHGEVTGPKQLVSLEALLEQQPLQRLLPFSDQLLAPLIRNNDVSAKTSLLPTLRMFLDEDADLHTTAEKLFVHVNTVRNRLHRITELTDRNPMISKDATELRIALWTQARVERMHSWHRRPFG